MSATPVAIAQKRIADCLDLNSEGRLYQRRDHLNLAGLRLTDEDLATVFDVPERALETIQFAQLRHLRFLDLTGNRLTRLPVGLDHFVDLEWLGLNFNLVGDLSGIGQLSRLRRLYLRGNPLSELPAAVGELAHLEELDITGCPVDRLPTSFGGLTALEYIGLTGTGLVPDQRAAWKEKGWVSLRKHLLESREQESKVQYIGKVVLVGAQESGKTCLQRALRSEPFVKGLKSTDGMTRDRLHLRMDGSLVTADERARTPGPRPDLMELTLWDMGGQDHYQHTHQMFFTPSAVYLVVMLPRQGGSVQELGRWIELVKRRTEGKATVVVVSTWCREHPADASISLDRLRQEHGDLVRGLVTVDSEDGTGIPDLRKLIADLVRDPATGCRQEWLPGWAAVLKELSGIEEAYIRWPRVEEICRRHRIADGSVHRQVIRTGHYIGSLLWREDIPAGEDVVILNPDWLCRAVARLLDDEATRKLDGLIALSDLPRVWSGEARDGTSGYARESHVALVELMEINELAYRPRAGGKRVGEGDHLLVTQMVQALPDPDLEKIWESISPPRAAESTRVVTFRRKGALNFEDVQDLVYILIFRLREFSLGRGGKRRAVHWQKGLLVTDDYGNAGRIERTENGLRVTVRYRFGDGLMHSILHRIGSRDDGFWEGRGLKRFEFIPCLADCPNQTPGAGLFDVRDCMEADQGGSEKIRCRICDEDLRIDRLIAGLPRSPSQLLSLSQSISRLEQCILTEGALTRERVREDGEKTREVLEQRSQELAMAADAILDAFTSEWKDGPRLFSLIPLHKPGWDPRTWTTMSFRVAVWCEASRRPVPLFRVPKKGERGEMEGSVMLELPREWVAGVRRALCWGAIATTALGAGAGVGAAGLVTTLGGVISGEDSAALAKELGEQKKAMDELAKALPEESGTMSRARSLGISTGENPFANQAPGFGTPAEGDLKLIRYLRDEYRKQDPAWGGLTIRGDGKFGRIWAHPKAEG